MESFASGFLPADLVVVISDRAGAAVLDKATSRQVSNELVPYQDRSRSEHETALLSCLRRYQVDHLLLAGYLRILSPDFLQQFPGVILNIHPSLLPDFPGLHAVRQQWLAGVRIAGATVHYVDAQVDNGPILLSGSIEVRGDEGEAGLAQRILLEVEHVIYRRAVWLLCHRLQNRASNIPCGS